MLARMDMANNIDDRPVDLLAKLPEEVLLQCTIVFGIGQPVLPVPVPVLQLEPQSD